jgi:ankyrin repeat protein
LAIASLGARATVNAATAPRVVDAAERRDTKLVTALLKQGADVNIPQPDGATALHWAAHWDDVALAKLLVAAKAQPNAANDYGVTPIFLAAGNGSAAMLSVLLDAGANANAALPTGETVLMTAVRSGSLPVVKRLLTAGADPNAKQVSKGQTALMWAATSQNIEVAKALLEAKADVHARSSAGFTPLMSAAREGSIEMSRLLMEAGDDVNEAAPDGSTPLLIATVRGHARLAMFFLDHDAKPDGEAKAAGYTPLHWAASMGETTITYRGVQAPGEWGAIPGVPDKALRMELVKDLIRHGANIEARITKPMMTVVYQELRSRIGGTPFFTAASSGDAPMMRLLVAYGADPLARATDGTTPLMVCAGAMGIAVPNVDRTIIVSERDRIDAMALAYELGNDLEGQNNQGYRAMHVAASAGFKDIITWLVSKGADLNAKSKDQTQKVNGKTVVIPGQTPRGTAEGYNAGALFARPDVAEFLGKLGARSEGKHDLEHYISQVADDGKTDDKSKTPEDKTKKPR